jgi:DNA-binding MarR family transcriptional regulator
MTHRGIIEHLVENGSDLSLRNVYVLRHCHANGPSTIKDISESSKGGLNRSGASRAVERLRELGYVTRTEHTEDRRSVLVALTPAGAAFIASALAAERG